MSNIFNLALLGVFLFSGVSGVSVPSPVVDAEIMPVNSATISSLKLTGYNAVPEQTNEDPHITASGARSNHEVVIARSRDLAGDLPYGTIVALSAGSYKESCGFEQVEHLIGYRVVADTMHPRKTRQVDVMFGTNDTVRLGKKHLNPAIVMGICEVSVDVVGHISISDIPDTQYELAMMVEDHLAMR